MGCTRPVVAACILLGFLASASLLVRHWKAIEAWSAEAPAQPPSDLEERLHPEGDHHSGSTEVWQFAAPALQAV